MRTIQERWNMFLFATEESLLEQVVNLTASRYAGWRKHKNQSPRNLC